MYYNLIIKFKIIIFIINIYITLIFNNIILYINYHTYHNYYSYI